MASEKLFGVIGFSVKSDKNICDAETVGLSKTTLGFRFIINGVHYGLKIISLTALWKWRFCSVTGVKYNKVKKKKKTVAKYKVAKSTPKRQD